MSCKTCGGTDGNHKPSLIDRDGIGNPGHKVAPNRKDCKFCNVALGIHCRLHPNPGMSGETFEEKVWRSIRPRPGLNTSDIAVPMLSSTELEEIVEDILAAHNAAIQEAVAKARVEGAIQELMSLDIDTQSDCGRLIDQEITRLRTELTPTEANKETT